MKIMKPGTIARHNKLARCKRFFCPMQTFMVDLVKYLHCDDVFGTCKVANIQDVDLIISRQACTYRNFTHIEKVKKNNDISP